MAVFYIIIINCQIFFSIKWPFIFNFLITWGNLSFVFDQIILDDFHSFDLFRSIKNVAIFVCEVTTMFFWCPCSLSKRFPVKRSVVVSVCHNFLCKKNKLERETFNQTNMDKKTTIFDWSIL